MLLVFFFFFLKLSVIAWCHHPRPLTISMPKLTLHLLSTFTGESLPSHLHRSLITQSVATQWDCRMHLWFSTFKRKCSALASSFPISRSSFQFFCPLLIPFKRDKSCCSQKAVCFIQWLLVGCFFFGCIRRVCRTPEFSSWRPGVWSLDKLFNF